MLKGAANAVKVQGEQEKAAWIGALVPAVEVDEAEAGDMAVVVVKLIDKRQAEDNLPHIAWPM